MQDSSLVRILKTFNRDELKEFEKFAGTPLFVSRSKVKGLFNVLKKHYPDFDSAELGKKEIYGHLFPGEEYNDALMRKLVSELYKAAEKYLAYVNFINDDFAYKKHLIIEANKRSLNKIAASNIKLAFSELEKDPVRNGEYYYNQYLLLEEKSWLLLLDSTAGIANLQESYSRYCNSFLINILRYYVRILNETMIVRYKHELYFIDKILDMVEGSRFLDVPAIAVHYHMVRALQDTSDKTSYYNSRDLLFKQGAKLGKEIETNLYITITNYCTRRATEGDAEFLREGFEVMKKFIKRRYHLDRGYMLRSTFDHMVMAALDLGEVHYAENFVRKYKDLLRPDERENILNYNYARIALKKKKPESALEFISTIAHSYSNTKVNIRLLNLQILYELGMIDPAFHSIDSFRHFLKSNKRLSDFIMEGGKIFLNLLDKLLKVKAGSSRVSLNTVKEVLSGKKNIMKRYWLLEKVKELELEKEG